MRAHVSRDQTGGPVQRVGQGQASRIVTVDVSYPDAMNIAGHEQVIWATGTGATALHVSGRVRNLPAGAIGYMHDYGNNVLIAVSRLDIVRRTIELCGDFGHVNGGVHIF